MLMLDFLPYLTAHKAHLGRAKVQAAMRAYFHAGHNLADDVSPFIKRRTSTQRKYGFGPDDMGDWDLAMMMVATTNAIPTLFWTAVYVLSSPPTAASLRAEIAAVTTTRSADPATGAPTMVIDVSKFASHCPLLCAAYQEAVRLCNRQMSIRVAAEDTTVAAAAAAGGKTYFIKKDSVVLLPSNIYSESTDIWGADARAFEPARWLRDSKDGSSSAGGKEAERLQKKAFFPFGGGKHLCPGRHFAFAEILGMVALLVVGYDVVMAEGEGPLRVPGREYRFFGEAVPKPVGAYDVLIRRKREFEGVKWGFDLGA